MLGEISQIKTSRENGLRQCNPNEYPFVRSPWSIHAGCSGGPEPVF
jgi:hypothetical protein